MEQEQENKTRAMAIKVGDSTFDRILAHYKDPDSFPLTQTEENQVERWRMIYGMMLNHGNRTDIVKMLAREGRSTAQAYIDIKNTETVFGSVMRANKEFEKVLHIEGLKDMLRRAIQKRDFKAEGTARKLLEKAFAFDKDEASMPDPEKYKAIKLDINIPQQYLEAIAAMKGNFNLTKPLDVDYTVIDEQINEGKEDQDEDE